MWHEDTAGHFNSCDKGVKVPGAIVPGAIVQGAIVPGAIVKEC